MSAISVLIAQGRSVVLVGGVGVGKSRLVAEVLAKAEEMGRSVIRTSGSPGAADLPLVPLATLLPSTRSPGRGPTDLVAAALRSLSELASTVGERVLLGVDDAHLLDASSAVVVHQALRLGSIALVASVRSGESLPVALADICKDDLAERIDVSPLSRDDTAALLRATVEDDVDPVTVDRIFSVSQGNPLYLKEMALGAMASGAFRRGGLGWALVDRPGSVGSLGVSLRLHALVEARLAGLSATEREVLDVLAVADHLGVDALQGWIDPSALENLERRGLVHAAVVRRRREVVVAHPLHAEVLRARMGAITLLRISRRLADLVEAYGARRRGDLLRLARWRLDGGGRANAELLLDAAEHAHMARDDLSAERYARAAIDAGADSRAHLALAEVLAELGRPEEAEELLAGVSIGSDEVRAAAAIRRSSNLLWALDQPENAVAVLDEAREVISDPDAVAELDGELAVLAVLAGRPAEALALAPPTAEVRPPRAVVRVALALAPALMLSGKPGAAIAVASDGYARQSSLDDQRGFGAAGTHIMFQLWALIESGDLTSADALLALVDSVLASSTDEVGRAWAAFGRGRLMSRRGYASAAVGAFDEAASRWSLVGQRVPARWATSGAVLASAWAGDHAGAAARAAVGLASEPRGMRMLEAEAQRALAWADVGSGASRAARDRLIAVASSSLDTGDVLHGVEAAHDLARLGHVAVSLELLAPVDTSEWPLGATRVRMVRALTERSVDGLAAAGAALSEAGAVLEAAEAYSLAARIIRGERRASAADRLAATASRLLDGCGPVATPALAGLSSAALLSGREREVADMARAGWSTKDIALELGLAERTVENHLQRVFVKLGINARGALAGALDTLSHRAPGAD